MSAVAAFLAAWIGWISTQTLLILLVAGLVIACAEWMLAVVREDEDRPVAPLLLAVMAGFTAVHWVAFDGAGPGWLQAAFLVVLFILYFSPFEGRAEGDPARQDDYPPPF